MINSSPYLSSPQVLHYLILFFNKLSIFHLCYILEGSQNLFLLKKNLEESLLFRLFHFHLLSLLIFQGKYQSKKLFNFSEMQIKSQYLMYMLFNLIVLENQSDIHLQFYVKEFQIKCNFIQLFIGIGFNENNYLFFIFLFVKLITLVYD